MLRRILFITFLFLVVFVQAQPGGQRAFEFLNLPVSAQSAALGGYFITPAQASLASAYDNPASIDSTLRGHLGLNYINFLSDINFGVINYAFKQRKLGTVVAGLQFLSYGQFDQTDDFGNVTGSFSAGEYAAYVGTSYLLKPRLSVGANVKLAFSDFITAQTQGLVQPQLGLGIDLGLKYTTKDERTVFAATVKNLGVTLVKSAKNSNAPMPLLIQAAASRKIANAPFRVMLLLNNLQTWRLDYDLVDPNAPIDPITGEPETRFNFDQIFRKGVVGVEFLPSQNFNLRFGYNHNRRQDLFTQGTGGLSGFSFGFGLKIKKLDFGYSLVRYHRAAASSHLGLSFRI